jgi:uncharacterized repeat protein (TIGR03803 family)
MQNNRFWAAVSRVLEVMTVTLIAALILAPGARAASTEKVLYSFTGSADGGNPRASRLIFDQAGNIYGTTGDGGAYGAGTVFMLTPNSSGGWTESVLYSFTGGSDGADPWAGVIFDSAGNLYGTATAGGAYGAGVVFQLTPNSDGTWTEGVLYTFTGGSDGADPAAGLIFDSVGNLYGTVEDGGLYGYGDVYELTPSSGGTWTQSVLHQFTGGKDGSKPLNHAVLIFDATGNLYGTTYQGGAHGFGVAYELTPTANGWQEKVLHSFNRSGLDSEDGLTLGPAGVLYGTTAGDYGRNYPGTAFKLTPNSGGTWTETVLHRFRNSDGNDPAFGVVFDSAGNLYGATYLGGHSNRKCLYNQTCGVVFELTPGSNKWNFHDVYRFKGGKDGANPAEIILDTANNIYGTTAAGGVYGAGVVYEITP